MKKLILKSSAFFLLISFFHPYKVFAQSTVIPSYRFTIENDSIYDTNNINISATIDCSYPGAIFGPRKSCGPDQKLEIARESADSFVIQALEYPITSTEYSKWPRITLTLEGQGHKHVVSYFWNSFKESNILLLHSPKESNISIKVKGLPLNEWLLQNDFNEADIIYTYGIPTYKNYPSGYYTGATTATGAEGRIRSTESEIKIKFDGFAFVVNKNKSELKNESRLWLMVRKSHSNQRLVFAENFTTHLSTVTKVNFSHRASP